jgi:hypothetical protein
MAGQIGVTQLLLLCTQATIIGKFCFWQSDLIEANTGILSAPLRETRQQWTKLFQTKLVNLFASSSPDLLKTEMSGNGTGYQVSDAEPCQTMPH